MRHEWFANGVMLGYRYDNSPIVWSDGTPVPPDPSHPYTQTARPGARAPHVWLSDGRSTLDLFGRSFVLLRLGDNAPSATNIVSAAEKRGVPFTAIDLNEPRVLAAYENRLVLVRPDGHVAWRADHEPADATALIDIIRGQTLHGHSGRAEGAIRNPDAHSAPGSGFRVRAPEARAPE
jgi:hypothetical protein